LWTFPVFQTLALRRNLTGKVKDKIMRAFRQDRLCQFQVI